MKKLETAQSFVHILMDKLGPVREILVLKDDKWEEWGLEELTARPISFEWQYAQENLRLLNAIIVQVRRPSSGTA